MIKTIVSRIAKAIPRILYIGVIALICTILPATHALADTDDTIDYNQFCTVKFSCPTFSPKSSGCDTSTSLVGGDNIEKAFNFFKSKGLSADQAAGVIGNLRQESGLNPEAQQDKSKDAFPKDGVGFGIAQWTYTVRQKPLVDFATQKNEPVTNLDIQLDYLWQEFTQKYASTYRALTGAGDYTSAVTIFEKGFEGAGNPQMEKRINFAKEVLDRFGNASASTTGGSASAPTNQCGSGSVNCDGAKGNAALLCTARKFDPYGYLWGGGHGDPESFMNSFNAQGGFTQPFKQVVDCSGLEVVSIWLTFGQKVIFATSAMAATPQLRHVTVPEAQPGDFMFKPGHTEIASINGGKTTFGAHTDSAPPGDQISEAQTKDGFWTDAYVYIGEGSDRQ
jgi:hypothetical protein